jgi:undecaprenyl-diphosphatase
MLKIQKNTLRLQIYLILSVALFAWAASLASLDELKGLELSLFQSINNWSQSWHVIFLIITQAGSAWMLFGATLFLLGIKLNRLALRFFCAGTVAFLLSEIFKRLIARPRPLYLTEGVQIREFLRFDNGFPSGHTAVATASALVVMQFLPKRWRWLCWLWIGLVGLSRIYLGVHAPLDVVGGFAIGVIVVCSGYLVHGKLKAVLKITKLKLQG